MNVNIRSILEKGSYDKERITFRCKSECEIGSYILLITTFNDDMPTNNVVRTYWFPDKTIGSGDLVIVYSKIGTDSERVLASGSKAHFFYMGLPAPVWNRDGVGAVLVEASAWTAQPSSF